MLKLLSPSFSAIGGQNTKTCEFVNDDNKNAKISQKKELTYPGQICYNHGQRNLYISSPIEMPRPIRKPKIAPVDNKTIREATVIESSASTRMTRLSAAHARNTSLASEIGHGSLPSEDVLPWHDDDDDATQTSEQAGKSILPDVPQPRAALRTVELENLLPRRSAKSIDTKDLYSFEEDRNVLQRSEPTSNKRKKYSLTKKTAKKTATKSIQHNETEASDDDDTSHESAELRYKQLSKIRENFKDVDAWPLETEIISSPFYSS